MPRIMAREYSPKQIELAVSTIKTLSIDAVEKANSGHPGTPMGLADISFELFTRHLRYDPKDPGWIGRDRFVLSCGHASMLVYSMLHLAGYDVSLEDLKSFRQWGSKTPGTPSTFIPQGSRPRRGRSAKASATPSASRSGRASRRLASATCSTPFASSRSAPTAT